MVHQTDGLPGQIAIAAGTARTYVRQLLKLHEQAGGKLHEMEERLEKGVPKPVKRAIRSSMYITTWDRGREPRDEHTPRAPHITGSIDTAPRKRKRHPDRKAQERTLALVAERGEVTPSFVAKHFKCTLDAARARLRTLAKTGLVHGPLDARETYKAAGNAYEVRPDAG